jgi:hypothetical protein
LQASSLGENPTNSNQPLHTGLRNPGDSDSRAEAQSAEQNGNLAVVVKFFFNHINR